MSSTITLCQILKFTNGELKYIVKNNRCRLLDGRRTPDYIEDYFEDWDKTSWKFDLDVALSFGDLSKESINKNGYVFKRSIPIVSCCLGDIL